MRKKEREVTDLNEIRDILENNDICRVAFKDNDGIYIVPLSYGYSLDNDNLVLYFHGAKEGRKTFAFENELEIGFEIDEKNQLKGKDDIGCSYTYFYRSIIGTGKASIVKDFEDKKNALDIIMRNVTKKDNFRYNKAAIDNVLVMKLESISYKAKKH